MDKYNEDIIKTLHILIKAKQERDLGKLINKNVKPTKDNFENLRRKFYNNALKIKKEHLESAEISIIDFEMSLKTIWENNIIFMYTPPNIFSKEKVLEEMKKFENSKIKIGMDTDKFKEHIKLITPKNINLNEIYNMENTGIIFPDNNNLKKLTEELFTADFLLQVVPHDYINFDKILNNLKNNIPIARAVLEKIDFDFDTEILTIDYKKIKINSSQTPPLFMYIFKYIFENNIKEKHYFSEMEEKKICGDNKKISAYKSTCFTLNKNLKKNQNIENFLEVKEQWVKINSKYI